MGRLEASQLRFQKVKPTKHVFASVIVVGALVLALLPFWTSAQDVLTRLVMSVGWYRSIQNVIVPYELLIVGNILTVIGLPIRVGKTYIEWTKANGGKEAIFLIWNCVGWQSVILFAVSLITGLAGRFTKQSKLEALLIGILGTYLLNITRLTLVILVYFAVGRPIGTVFHDYFSNLLILAWLIWFWWFAHRYVLEPKK